MRVGTKRFLLAFLGIALAASGAPARGKDRNKKKVSEILRSLENVYVDGYGGAAEYVRNNLEQQTCLKHAFAKSDAEAVLEVEDLLESCRGSLTGLCKGVDARLKDAKTGKILRFWRDENLANEPAATFPAEVPGKWVLWNLKNSCCKDRPTPPSSPPPRVQSAIAGEKIP